MQKLLILDGNSIINRAFFAIRGLTNADGTPTGALHGFKGALRRHIKEERPDYIYVAFDLPAPTFRHTEFADYKAARQSMPPELRLQMPMAREFLNNESIPYLTAEGYEADDIIGTVARICEEKEIMCVIVTGDRDCLQLASPFVKIKLAATNPAAHPAYYDESAVMQRYGVTPKALIEVKALAGDKSDNIPGVPGIGEKTAIQLIKSYGTVDNLYAAIERSEVALTKTVLAKLQAGRDSAYLSRRLAEIFCDVPLNFNLDVAMPSEEVNGETQNEQLSFNY